MVDTRIIEIADQAAKLRAENGLLVIEPPQAAHVTVPFKEIAALVLAQPRLSCTHAALAGVTAVGGIVVICDDRFLPVGMMLPVQAHHLQTERIHAQITATLPTKKRLWADVVRARIRTQAAVLADTGGDGVASDVHGLRELARRVRSGDPDNLEAQAAKQYWRALFGPAFRRDRQADDQNRLLNYGYTVLRAMTARAVCAAGLHPSIGIHHHNRYDTFSLASDLMEPFRASVERTAVELVREMGPQAPLDRNTKTRLIDAITGRFNYLGESRTLFGILAQIATAVAQVFLDPQQPPTVSFPDVV